MSNPTTPFSWQMPTATDLVTDLPADFEVFGQAVATSMADLLGGTTGQVLSKASNADMDFTFVTPTDQTPLTTKGDLFTFSTVDARLPVGTNNQTLVADSTASTGLKWATPAGGGKVLQVVSVNYSTVKSNSTSNYVDTDLTATITPTSNTSKVLVIVSQNGCTKSAGNAANRIALRLLRGATSILTAGDYFGYSGSAAEVIGESISFSYLDSPATTSATIYKTQFQNPVNVASVSVQFTSSHNSTITLLEIGA